ncbi:MAG: efflux RND transporter periplasmic adaptor subunit [Desulfobulbaceae bacterium]|jgi:multidrug efflux system membrane fusion protein|nr:efflux RND transporter periplasmic adaptor subunit [Desulfobulbaceae bacterium]
MKSFRCIALAFLLAASAACSGGKDAPPQKAAVAVVTATSRAADTPVVIEATGRIEASKTVGIRARVGGALEKIHFQEGQAVQAGQILFTIDRRPYLAALHNKEAALAKSRAELAHAEKEQARYQRAVQKGLVSHEEAENAAVSAASLQATVLADQAAVESARLDLDYCQLAAPFSGIAGESQADPGDMVKANADAPLVTINAIRPAHIAFSLPGKYLADLRQRPQGKPLTVSLYVAGREQTPLTGEIFFMDNSVGENTGAILLKARYANQHDELWPGQMLRLTIITRIIPQAVLVPSQAVQIGQDEMYVYVVKDDATVAYRPVTVGVRFGAETVVDKGLSVGEKVVTEGQMQLRPGSLVREQVEKPAAGAEATP